MPLKKIIWHKDSKADINTIKSVEREWNIAFPEEYLEIVLLHNSGIPELMDKNGELKSAIVDIPAWHGRSTEFGLSSFYKISKYSVKSDILDTYNAFKERLPEPDKIFPFAESGSGDILFFDYRKNPDRPAIVFMDHEEAFTEEDITQAELKEKPVKEWLEMNLYPVCNSFSELLDLLYIDEED